MNDGLASNTNGLRLLLQGWSLIGHKQPSAADGRPLWFVRAHRGGREAAACAPTLDQALRRLHRRLAAADLGLMLAFLDPMRVDFGAGGGEGGDDEGPGGAGGGTGGAGGAGSDGGSDDDIPF